MPQDDSFERPHDRLFRYTFERPEIAEGELRCILPPDVVAALDFTSLTVEPGTLVDPEHAELETDLLYRVKLAGHDSFVYRTPSRRALLSTPSDALRSSCCRGHVSPPISCRR